jgi:hypothetical protein
VNSAAPGASPSVERAAPLARAVLAALVVAAVAALFYAQALKHRDPLLKNPLPGVDSFQPSAGVQAGFLVKSTIDDVLTIAVVTPAGRPVAVVRSHLRVRTDRSVKLHWDGRTVTGALARSGSYELRVHFARAGTTLIVPGFVMVLRGPGG